MAPGCNGQKAGHAGVEDSTQMDPARGEPGSGDQSQQRCTPIGAPSGKRLRSWAKGVSLNAASTAAAVADQTGDGMKVET